MLKMGSDTTSSPGLTLSKSGSWSDMVNLSESIESLLKSVKPEDVNGGITEKEFKNLFREWKEWRPHADENYSGEMRKKTAKQSSVEESNLEKEGKNATEEVKEAGGSISKVAADAREEGLKEIVNHLSNAFKCTSRAVDSKVRQGIRSVEETVYENIILRANSLYFDNSVLNAVLSKRAGIKNPEKFDLTLHSNNPHLREFFAERIDWDDC